MRFDIDYCCKSHMPWVASLLGSELLPQRRSARRTDQRRSCR